VEAPIKDPIPAVMISSTIIDLPAHRDAVEDTCLKLRMFPLTMKHQTARSGNKLEASFEMVDEADIYVGIIGRQYGTIPTGYSKSMTELEYERAVSRQVDRRIFLMDLSQDSGKESLSPELVRFRRRLDDEVAHRVFTSVDDLRFKVSCALGDYWRTFNPRQVHNVARFAVDVQFEEERRKWLQRLLSHPSPENAASAAIAVADFAKAGTAARQLDQWLGTIDWRAVLRHWTAIRAGGHDSPLRRDAAAIAKAICDLRSNLPQDLWAAVRNLIVGALSESEDDNLSEFYMLLFRAIGLCNPKTAESLIDQDGIFVDRLSDSPQTIIARHELKSLLQPSSNGLRIGLDAWPGYFPLFVMEDRLRSEKGIALFDIESSREKMRMLREKRIDLVATTPGGLLGPNNPDVSDLRVVAILNQSAGADQILIRGSSWSRQVARWPEIPELQSATWIVTAGSTSELFAKAVCRHFGFEVPPERWLRTVDYHDALDAIMYCSGVAVCSTWEPYSSWMQASDPGISLLCTTADFEPLVMDCLVARRMSDRLRIDEGVGDLLALWDECLAGNLHLEPRNIPLVCNRLVRFEHEDYRRMVRGVHYFDSSQMQTQSAAGTFRSVFERVWQTWRGQPESQAIATSFSRLFHYSGRWLPQPN
jgi:hypothetical protein